MATKKNAPVENIQENAAPVAPVVEGTPAPVAPVDIPSEVLKAEAEAEAAEAAKAKAEAEKAEKAALLAEEAAKADSATKAAKENAEKARAEAENKKRASNEEEEEAKFRRKRYQSKVLRHDTRAEAAKDRDALTLRKAEGKMRGGIFGAVFTPRPEGDRSKVGLPMIAAQQSGAKVLLETGLIADYKALGQILKDETASAFEGAEDLADILGWGDEEEAPEV